MRWEAEVGVDDPHGAAGVDAGLVGSEGGGRGGGLCVCEI